VTVNEAAYYVWAMRRESPTFRAVLASRGMTMPQQFGELCVPRPRLPPLVGSELPKLLLEMARALQGAETIEGS
jgi:hypothetical protein